MTRSIVVEIAGCPYLAGLWWQIRSGGAAGRKVMLKEARETAARFEAEKYTHAAIRAEQYGLAYQGEGQIWPAKTASLAAALRPSGQRDAFLGIFCLDEAKQLWWVCGLLRGLIVAEGDEVFGSKEEAASAAKALRLMLENVPLTEICLETREESHGYIKGLLGPELPLIPLFQKERPLALMIGAGALAVILLGAGASWMYSGYQDMQKTRNEARQAAEKEALKADILANPRKYFKTEWLSAPTALAAGKQCAGAILALPLSVNAWGFQEAVCGPGEALTVIWAHRKGASFTELPKGANFGQSAQEAVAETDLSPLPARPGDSGQLLTRNRATALLYELTQNLASQLVLSWEPPEQYRVDETTSLSAPWQRGQFELTRLPAAAILDEELFAALGGYPGAMLGSLTRQTNTLTIKGYIYALTAR